MANVTATVDQAMLEQLRKMANANGASATSAAPMAPPAPVKKPVFVLKSGETAFSDLFGIANPINDFGIMVYEDEKWDEHHRNMIPDVDPDYIFPPEVTEVVVSALVRGKRSQFVHGPKGSGKSSLGEQVCAKLRIPFYRVNMAEDAEGSRLFGGVKVKNGELGWAPGPAELAATAMYDGVLKGAFLQVDEVSAAPAGINLNMQWMLERNGKIMLSEKPEGDTLIRPGTGFHVLCTDNTVLQGDTTGKYSGTNVQNEAFLDRMSSVVYLGYLSAEHELGIITAKTGVKMAEAKKMRALAELIRAAYDQSKINFNISPRGLIEWGEETCHWNNDVAMGFKYTFFNKLVEADKSKVNDMFKKVYAKEVA